MSIKDWVTALDTCNFKLTEFIDVSADVSKYLTVNTPKNEFLNTFINPKLKHHSKKEIYTEKLIEIYDGYFKLQKLLNKGLFQYGILRFSNS
jgi:hypothetical protein